MNIVKNRKGIKRLIPGLILATALFSGCGTAKTSTAQLDFTAKNPPAGSAESGYQWADNTLTLSGFKLTADGGDGILLPDGASVRVEGASEIRVTNAPSESAAIRSVGSITVTGAPDAPLTLENAGGIGICVQANKSGAGNLTVTDGASLVVRSAYDGIDVAGDFRADSSAHLDITAGGSDSEYLAGIYTRSGKLTVDGDKTAVKVLAQSATQNAYGIQCNGGMKLLGGTIEATAIAPTAGKNAYGVFARGENAEILGGTLYAKGDVAAFLLADKALTEDPANPAGGVVDKNVTLGADMTCSSGVLQTVYDDSPIVPAKKGDENRWAYLTFAPAGALTYDTATGHITGAATELTIERSLEGKAQAVLKDMTLEEKVGQLFITRPEALDIPLTPEQINDTQNNSVTGLSTAMAETLQKYPVGGVALFGKNISTPEQLRSFIADLQQQSAIPLLMCVDEEGGRVARLANTDGFDLPKYESMGKVGESGNPEDAYQVGLTIGSYLKPYGFNVDFAPVADTNTNPENIVIGARSFGSDPELVAKMVTAEISGLHEAGMLSCIKHFPGHGDTTGDTHDGYVSVLKTWEELKKCELIPFIGALDDTDLVMAAHITTPNVTSDGLPATMSRELLEGKLRNELGYQGVIITDAMAMGAITETYTSAESAVKAIQAGVDIVLMPQNFVEAYEGVCAAVKDGTISEARLDESVLRILTLKEKFQ